MHKGRGAAGGREDTLAARPAAKEFGKSKNDEHDQLIGAVVHGVSGSYSVEGYIGKGGMGLIYTAINPEGERIVVKFISPRFMSKAGEDKEKSIQRFLKEASAGRIDHPNVVKVYDVGMYRDNFFIAMEYLPGKDLGEMKNGRVFVWEELAPLIMQACDGLQAAHDLGMIHRDLSQDNIRVVESEGRQIVKLMDFGLVKFQDDDDGLTKTGNIAGKISHIAPEQVEKSLLQRESYDHRVDIFALGALMFIELTGEKPFKGEDDLQSLVMRTKSDPPNPRSFNPAIPPEVEMIVLKAMARYEDDRYQSARELKEAIMRTMPNLGLSSKAGTEAVFLQHILDSTEVSGSDPLHNLGDLRIEQQHYDERPDTEVIRRRGSGWKAVKWLSALAIAASAAYGGYVYRNEIRTAVEQVKREYFDPASGQSAKRPAAPAPSSSAAPARTGFMATIESTPANANVFEIINGQRESIGTTPLQRRFEDGEHELLFTKRGFAQKRASVSGSQPVIRVNLTRYQKARTPALREEPGSESPLQPDDEEGSDPDNQEPQ